jgi:hypothetical protein
MWAPGIQDLTWILQVTLYNSSQTQLNVYNPEHY